MSKLLSIVFIVCLLFQFVYMTVSSRVHYYFKR